MVDLNSVEGIESLIDKRTNPLKKQIKELKNLVNELKEAINFTDSSLLLKTNNNGLCSCATIDQTSNAYCNTCGGKKGNWF